MSKTKEEVLKFQWKKGDKFGKVVQVEREDDKMYYFTDGSQIFKNVVEEFLEKVINDQLPFPGADQVNIIGSKSKNQNKKSVPQAEKYQSELHGLVTKLSKKHVVPFEPRINLNVISPEMFKMLIENADENAEDLIKTITDVAMFQIEINKLKEFLQEEIIKFLNNYYNE